MAAGQINKDPKFVHGRVNNEDHGIKLKAWLKRPVKGCIVCNAVTHP
jgi:hypothetical protein